MLRHRNLRVGDDALAVQLLVLERLRLWLEVLRRLGTHRGQVVLEILVLQE